MAGHDEDDGRGSAAWRSGRWLLVTVVFVGALALLFPMVIASIRDLLSLSAR